jgi:hypothetical protein
MGVMRILDRTGDTMIEWTGAVPESLRKAENSFNQLIDERQMAFGRRAGAMIDEAERIFSFDPALEEILWVRPIQGG